MSGCLHALPQNLTRKKNYKHQMCVSNTQSQLVSQLLIHNLAPYTAGHSADWEVVVLISKGAYQAGGLSGVQTVQWSPTGCPRTSGGL